MIMIKNDYDLQLNMIKNTIDVCGIFKSGSGGSLCLSAK